MVAPAWTALELTGGRADTFVFPVSHQMGLPPGEVARLVRATVRELTEWRPRIALWVPVVDSPPRSLCVLPFGDAGNTAPDAVCPDTISVEFAASRWGASEASSEVEWFRQAIYQRLWGALRIPYAVTDGSRPQLRDFSYPPARSHSTAPALPAESPRILERPARQQQALLTLTRLRTATTAEVAAYLVCFRRYTLDLLKALEDDGCIERTVYNNTKYEAWSITRRGVLIGRRGWGIPPGVQFGGGRERTSSGSRHRRTARLWPNWLREAYPDADVWAGWSEPRGVGTGRHQPDALAWGRYRDRETIFWLEVESGRRSREELRRDTIDRLRETISKYADYQLVYATLAVPWAGRAVLPALAGKKLPPHVAVVIEDWKNAGSLPRPHFGGVAVARSVKKQ